MDKFVRNRTEICEFRGLATWRGIPVDTGETSNDAKPQNIFGVQNSSNEIDDRLLSEIQLETTNYS